MCLESSNYRALFVSGGESVKTFLRLVRLKACILNADEQAQMCSFRPWLPTLITVALTIGCSSKKSKSAGDAGGDANAAGDAVKSMDSRADQVKGLDTGSRDVFPDLVGSGDTRDTRDAITLRDLRGADVKDDETGSDDAAWDGSRDVTKMTDGLDAPVFSDTGKPDSPVDTLALKDTAQDVKRVDAPPDVPPPNGCLNPIVIPTDDPKYDVTVSTVGESHKFDLPCGSAAPDMVFRFTLAQMELIYADTLGATWNTVLHFSKTCPPSADAGTTGPGMVTCSDDACGTPQSQVIAMAPNPGYYLFLSGANGESGSVTLHFQHAAIGTGVLKQLGSGTGSVSGTTDNNTTPPTDVCEASGAADNYWWATCPDYAGGALSASTCTGTAFDTLLSLQIPRTKAVSCVDDTESCGRQSVLAATVPAGAGLNVLTIFGGTYKDLGPYVVTYTRP
jgi:hypothetical protein